MKAPQIKNKKFSDRYLELKTDSRMNFPQREAQTLIASHNQAAKKQTPPNGVMAPNQRIPVAQRMYNEPEKMKIPTRNNKPTQPKSLFGSKRPNIPTVTNARE